MITNDSGIYLITNNANGKQYIGSTSTFRKRKNRHFSDLALGRHHNKYLQRAWNLDGEINFEFAILLICEKSDLLRYEQYFIEKMRPEYNLCQTAGSVLGVKHDEEHKRKTSAARIGRKHSEETKRKMSQTLKEIKKSKLVYLFFEDREEKLVFEMNYGIANGFYETIGNSRNIDGKMVNQSLKSAGFRLKIQSGANTTMAR